jgi:multiple sugar transport system permease protein
VISSRRARGLNTLLTSLQFALVGLVILVPVAWMVASSFKTSAEVTAYPPRLLFGPTLANYNRLFGTTPFLEYARNSTIVAGASTILGLLLAVPAAYAVSWYRITWPATLTLAARMAPGTLFLLPWYILFSRLGMIGSHWALTLTHTVITMPLVLWVMMSFFDAIPREVLESALIDGCSPGAALTRVALPLVRPGVVVSTILAFVFAWNYFLFALVLSGFSSKTLPVAAFNFIGEGATNWGGLMAAATLIALPPLLLAFCVQRWLVHGLTIGAVKG